MEIRGIRQNIMVMLDQLLRRQSHYREFWSGILDCVDILCFILHRRLGLFRLTVRLG